MFEYLKGYEEIFVTGMQRTGTTICARMIQYDIEAPYCIWTGNNVKRILDLKEYPIEIPYPVIFHCPGLSHLIHRIESETELDKLATVWVRRDKDEIVNSAIKVHWDPRSDLETYNLLSTRDLKMDINMLITAKESRWKEQKKEIQNWFEVDYEDLKSHPLWINDKDRSFRGNHRSTSPGLVGVIGSTPYPWEGGELEPLLKEFPKDE